VMSDTAGQIPALRALFGRLAAGHPETDEAAGWDGARPDTSSTLPTRPPPAPAAKPQSTTPPTAEEQTLIERRNSPSRFQAALEASTRTDTTLSGLFRAIQHLTEGVSGAREANDGLISELEALRSLLGLANEQQLAHKHKLSMVEQSLERQRQSYEQEKNYL